jgi:hypothetical protein
MIAGTVAAMRASRERDRRAATPWRDGSLDDWRRERRESAAAGADPEPAAADEPAEDAVAAGDDADRR